MAVINLTHKLSGFLIYSGQYTWHWGIQRWGNLQFRWAHSAPSAKGLAESPWYLAPSLLRKTKHLHYKELHLGYFPLGRRSTVRDVSNNFVCMFVYFGSGWIEFRAFIRSSEEGVTPEGILWKIDLKETWGLILGSAFPEKVKGPGVGHTASTWWNLAWNQTTLGQNLRDWFDFMVNGF